MKILIVLALLGGTFVLSVLGVKFAKGCSMKRAVQMCRDSVKSFVSALLEPTPQYFSTIVGWDGYRISPKLVDAEFVKVRENFASCFCTWAGISADTNLVCYRFDIQRKPNSLDDETLTTLIQKEAEEAVANTMRLYDCYLPTEPLTLVQLFPSVLWVGFARTEEGIKILDNQKRNIQKRKLMAAKRTIPDSMTESWDKNHE